VRSLRLSWPACCSEDDGRSEQPRRDRDRRRHRREETGETRDGDGSGSDDGETQDRDRPQRAVPASGSMPTLGSTTLVPPPLPRHGSAMDMSKQRLKWRVREPEPHEFSVPLVRWKAQTPRGSC
jgi:hypothetical protein